MKNIKIYERKGTFFIRASSRTVMGVWVDNGDCYAINVDSENEKIGKYIHIALKNSHTNIPHPTDFKSINEPLFEAAKVKNWSTFGKMAKCIIVYVDRNIQINPTKNKSNIKQGFVLENDTTVTIPLNTNDAELGNIIKEVLLSCE